MWLPRKVPDTPLPCVSRAIPTSLSGSCCNLSPPGLMLAAGRPVSWLLVHQSGSGSAASLGHSVGGHFEVPGQTRHVRTGCLAEGWRRCHTRIAPGSRGHQPPLTGACGASFPSSPGLVHSRPRCSHALDPGLGAFVGRCSGLVRAAAGGLLPCRPAERGAAVAFLCRTRPCSCPLLSPLLLTHLQPASVGVFVPCVPAWSPPLGSNMCLSEAGSLLVSSRRWE